MCGLNAGASHGANGGGGVVHSAGEEVKLCTVQQLWRLWFCFALSLQFMLWKQIYDVPRQ